MTGVLAAITSVAVENALGILGQEPIVQGHTGKVIVCVESCICKFCNLIHLRKAFQHRVVGIEAPVIVGLLLVVGSNVHMLHDIAVYLQIPHEPHLVKAGTGEVLAIRPGCGIAVPTVGVFGHYNPKGQPYFTLAIEANTCGIGADDRKVGSQGPHGSTHTHIAGCSVDIVRGRQAVVDVGILCFCDGCYCQ